jgi:Zn-dependent protease
VSLPIFDLTPQQLILRFCALLFIAAVHGVTVAGAAVALGDAGPRHDGRLSLNPFAHLDILGGISAVLFSVGWIKPIAIDPAALRIGRIGLVVIVVVAAIEVLVFAVALQFGRPLLLPSLSDTPSTLTFGLIETIGQLSIWFALINLLPVPPLTGSHLLTAIMPAAGEFTRRYHIYFALALTALAATGIVTRVLEPVYRIVAEIILRS